MKKYQSPVEMFSIGVGPSSSHTVGPMRAANTFVRLLKSSVAQIQCTLYGSLADTGKGHGTDNAIVLGLLGEDPESVPIDQIASMLQRVKETEELRLPNKSVVSFKFSRDLIFARQKTLPRNPNGMHFSAVDTQGEIVADEIVYSVGGGFIVNEQDWGRGQEEEAIAHDIPYPFLNAKELLGHCKMSGLSISDLVLANEAQVRPLDETREKLDNIWNAMDACMKRGITKSGTLSGGLKVERRAKACYDALKTRKEEESDPLSILDWVNLYAMAVSEENASGGRVVTAPTNGAAGVIPAVLKYALEFKTTPYQDGIHRFLLTAGAIATIYKKNASLSGADVGCQGEVGVACSMAAGALTEYLGGTPAQVEFSAEIGMEHNLGLTCDPIGGLVQIPCIERNAMGAVKAINASRLAMAANDTHYVSLDKVIKTMLATGRDMQDKYKETARGGLAVNVVEC